MSGAASPRTQENANDDINVRPTREIMSPGA